MTSREYILSQIRDSRRQSVDMPDLTTINPVEYQDRIEKFMRTVEQVGGHAVLLDDGADVNAELRNIYPSAKVIASSLSYIDADKDPDMVADASDLADVDLGVVEGRVAVAENGCVWVPQTMKERAVMFISQSLAIIVDRNDIVSNMHEAYSQIQTPDLGYGCFISGPSKTADIAQALVMGAQAAREVTVVII